MEIIERVYEELKKQNRSAADLARHLNVTTGQTTAWKRRKTDPPAKYLPKIAEFFNVSVDYLLGKEPKIETNILSYSGNERVKSVINTIINSNIDDNDLKIIEAVLSKYNL